MPLRFDPRLFVSFSHFLISTFSSPQLSLSLSPVSRFILLSLYALSVRNNLISFFYLLPRTTVIRHLFTRGSATLHPWLPTFRHYVAKPRSRARPVSLSSSHLPSTHLPVIPVAPSPSLPFFFIRHCSSVNLKLTPTFELVVR